MTTIPKPLVIVNQWTIVLFVVFSLVMQNNLLLIFPFLFGISSIMLGFHPIMFIAKKILSKPLSQYVQEDQEQQKFNQYIAVSFLTAAIITQLLNCYVVSIIFAVMVGVAAFIAIMGFCVGCFIRFQYSQWQHRRKQALN